MKNNYAIVSELNFFCSIQDPSDCGFYLNYLKYDKETAKKLLNCKPSESGVFRTEITGYKSFLRDLCAAHDDSGLASIYLFGQEIPKFMKSMIFKKRFGGKLSNKLKRKCRKYYNKAMKNSELEIF